MIDQLILLFMALFCAYAAEHSHNNKGFWLVLGAVFVIGTLTELFLGGV